MVLKAKSMTKTNIQGFLNIYKDGEIQVVVNGEIWRAIKVKRCVRQGSPLSMIHFLYNMDPCRLTGISLYKMPTAGPVLSGEAALPSVEEKFVMKGYADHLKVALKTMAEFLFLDMILAIFEAASGCLVHRDQDKDKCKVLLIGNWKHLN